MKINSQIIIGLLISVLSGGLAFAQYDLDEIRDAAERGYSPAQFNIAWMYRMGDVVNKDDKEFEKWIRRAADQGDATSQFTVGCIYFFGIGVVQNYHEAGKLFLASAKNGSKEAQNNLGWMYVFGNGFENNLDEAVRWFHKAAEQGLSQSKHNLDVLDEIIKNKSSGRDNFEMLIQNTTVSVDTNARKTNQILYVIGIDSEKDRKEADKLFDRAAQRVIINGTYIVESLYTEGILDKKTKISDFSYKIFKIKNNIIENNNVKIIFCVFTAFTMLFLARRFKILKGKIITGEHFAGRSRRELHDGASDCQLMTLKYSENVNELLNALSEEHKVIAERASSVKTAIENYDVNLRKELIVLNLLLKRHFFHDDMEMFPVIIKLFYREKLEESVACLFENDKERSDRLKYNVSGKELIKLRRTEYDDRDLRSEIISFSRITLQVFEIIDEYLHGKQININDCRKKILGVIQIVETRIEYEEEELFPKLRLLAMNQNKIQSVHESNFAQK
ncbi:MAG: sel1 repeat family protein [Magnetococcus sp. YQC-3]